MSLDLTENSATSYPITHRVSLGRRTSDNANQPMATNDHSSASIQRTQKLSLDRRVDVAYDTDGGTNSRHAHLHHHVPNHNVESLVSPRLNVRRMFTAQRSNNTAVVPLQRRTSNRNRLSSNQGGYEDREDEHSQNDEGRRSIRINHRLPPRPVRTSLVAQPSIIVTPPTTAPTAPLRLIFMRHAERMNQALGADWYIRAFSSNAYKPFDRNMPSNLPNRRTGSHFEYDVPLTVRGLKSARLTGRALQTHNHLPSVCLSSTSLRCVQTAERVLSGMDLRDQIPIRIEPAIFECPHTNPKLVESFMTRKEFTDISYNVKMDYKPILDRVNFPENLEEYFDRSAMAMRKILDRYGRAGETVLIVTHAPGLLALTDALKGQRPVAETFYRTVATYPPLALFIAEYDGTRWRYSEQPYNIIPV